MWCFLERESERGFVERESGGLKRRGILGFRNGVKRR